jgi:methyl-accepting chemotaxis protein
MAKQEKESQYDSFSDLYHKAVEGNHFLTTFIPGHLMLEFLLIKLLQIYDPNLAKIAERLSAFELINLAKELDLISDEQETVFKKINAIRNKLSHYIAYQPTMEEVKELFQLAASASEDFTDGIDQAQQVLDEAHKPADLDDWVFGELFVQLSYDLHHEYQDRGGDEELF